MAEITAITPQVKDKDRCNIYIDGQFYCGLKLETAILHRLKVGNSIELEELDAIQLENEKAQALDKAMTHLSASMKTEKQMVDFLKKKGYVDIVCTYVLDKLREYGFVNDAEYCEQYVSSAGKGKGARLIALELKKRGASDACIEEALQQLGNETESAIQVLKKYMKGREFTKENLSRGYRHLMSKGFDYETAKDALDALRTEED